LALRAVVLSVLVLVALPGTAGAATASVEPFVESPSVDPFGSCSRYMMCPPDMVVFTAEAGEGNQLVVTVEPGTYPRSRFVLRDQSVPVQAGAGCAQLDPNTVACDAGALGPVQLGDADDWFASGVGGGDLFGGDGHDVLQRRFGPMAGGEGNDVLIGDQGAGGGGDDVLAVRSGSGDAGDDELRCFPPGWCHLDGGAGDDLLTSGTSRDRLFGRRGDDVLRGGAGVDTLGGGPGDDRLVGGAGRDDLRGDSGTDRLVSREDRSAGERTKSDQVDCGTGRRDRAVADRRDDVERCERVRPAPATASAAAAAP
jgi:Ca2+-binding RTX toxin-like protein